MTKVSIPLCIYGLVTIALILSGCGTSKTQEVSVDVSCQDFAEAHSIAKTVEVPVNGLLTVTLCSNATTGFRWGTAGIGDPTILKETNHEFVSPGENEKAPRVGAAGQEVWTFRTLKAGTSTISIAYSQPWEGGEMAVWTYDLTVVVK